MFLCFLLLINHVQRLPPEDRGVGLQEDRAPGEKLERRGVSSIDPLGVLLVSS